MFINTLIAMRYCIAKAREMEKNKTIKIKPLKNGGAKKCWNFLSMHPIPTNIPISPAHKTKNQLLPAFLPISFLLRKIEAPN